MENTMVAPQKTKNRFSKQCSNTTPWDIPKKNMNQLTTKAPAHPYYSQQLSYEKSQDAPLLLNRLRKCGIFSQPQRKMKFCHSWVNGWIWRT
jgi:hypothetical protein